MLLIRRYKNVFKIGPGMVTQTVVACPECRGEGSELIQVHLRLTYQNYFKVKQNIFLDRTVPREDVCGECSGNKTKTVQKVLFPLGRANWKIRLRGT